MLEFLTGEVVKVTADAAVVSVGGVGLRVQMPARDLAGLQGTATIYTVLQLKEDDVSLFGFTTERAREVFRMLTTVQGIGGKVAVAVLSVHAPEAVERAIVAGDVGALTLVPGLGKRKAERIIVDLKDKVGGTSGADVVPSGALAEVREALKGLGYSPQEVQEALKDLPADGDAPTLLRFALKALGSRELVG